MNRTRNKGGAFPRETRGIMRGVLGMYEGAEIDLKDGPVIIGRDASRANLVYEAAYARISRKHCEISYQPQTGMYQLIDYSSTGTYKNGSSNCLPQNMPVTLEPGSMIDIGDETNRFVLL